MNDFARFTPKEVQAHCRKNLRSLALDPNGYRQYQANAMDRAARYEQEADAEARAFRTWRVWFLAPRREAWGHLDEASRQAEARAGRALQRLNAAWVALAPLLTAEERERWLADPPTTVAENAD